MEKEQKLAKSVSSISGTIPNHQNSQLLVSSGIPSLDNLLGGGFPVGTLILLEEDQSGSYAKIITKYFLAEGIVCKQSSFIASQDVSTDKFVRELPSVIDVDPEPEQKKANTEKMKIAFRYHYLPTAEKQKDLGIGHYFDLSKNIAPEVLFAADITHWRQNCEPRAPATFCNPAYHDLLESIHNKIKTGNFSISDTSKDKSILRIAINALGSPMWLGHYNLSRAVLDQANDLNMFLYCLRAVVRNAFAVAFVTVPSHLIEKESIDRCIYSSDIAFKLQAFSGTQLEKNPILSEYHGYFHIVKFAAINSFISKHPGSVEYTFKLKRKKFYIEKLHLPPDLQAVEESRIPTMSCSSNSNPGGKHLLDF